MIKPSELLAIQEDLIAAYDAISKLETRYPMGIPDRIFNHKVTARLRELLEVAQNIEHASYNRDIKENGI